MTHPKHFAIHAPRIFDGEAWHADQALLIVDREIYGIAGHDVLRALKPDFETVRLPAGTVVAPGFIDVQVNGGGGVLLNDAPTLDGIRTILAAHRPHGTTGMLPTLITDRREVMEALLAVAEEALKIPGVLGFHLEGPFIAPARKGCHREDYIRRPDANDIALLGNFGQLGRSYVTVAPERVEAADIRALTATGLRVAAGHTDATAAEMARAVDAGMTGATHIFNAMTPIAVREPGPAGYTLDDDRLYCGLITDGHHVHAANVRATYKLKGRDHVMLVTDAMPTVGSDKPWFDLFGMRIEVKGGRLVYGADTLAGAHVTMMQCVARFIEMTGAPLEDALIMASRTPATFLGLSDRLGSLSSGHQADLVVFDEATMTVRETWVRGQRSIHPSA